MAVKANPQDAAQAWVTGMTGASAKYTAGVQSVRVAPGQAAAAASQLWATNVANARQKFASNVAKVSLSAWQEAAATKGAPRLASGAQAAQAKYLAFQSNFLPKLASIVGSLPARGTFDQNMARFAAYATQLHGAAGTF